MSITWQDRNTLVKTESVSNEINLESMQSNIEALRAKIDADKARTAEDERLLAEKETEYAALLATPGRPEENV